MVSFGGEKELPHLEAKKTYTDCDECMVEHSQRVCFFQYGGICPAPWVDKL